MIKSLIDLLRNLQSEEACRLFLENIRWQVLKTVDIRSPKTVISVHFSSSKPMAMQIY